MDSKRANDNDVTLKLPVPLGTTVWQICNNPAYNGGVESAEIFLFGEVRTPRQILQEVEFTLGMLDEWGLTVFKTEIDGKKAMDEK